jgi:hypothetical protein
MVYGLIWTTTLAGHVEGDLLFGTCHHRPTHFKDRPREEWIKEVVRYERHKEHVRGYHNYPAIYVGYLVHQRWGNVSMYIQGRSRKVKEMRA